MKLLPMSIIRPSSITPTICIKVMIQIIIKQTTNLVCHHLYDCFSRIFIIKNISIDIQSRYTRNIITFDSSEKNEFDFQLNFKVNFRHGHNNHNETNITYYQLNHKLISIKNSLNLYISTIYFQSNQILRH
jgi:hypothetical protein